MPRQSITFTEPNDDWLRSQVEGKEYSSKSDVVNDLVRKARSQENELEQIRKALVQGEESGISDLTPSEIMARVIQRKRKNR